MTQNFGISQAKNQSFYTILIQFVSLMGSHVT